eukprot:8453156-Lingulodinium_polyedra.AAC.1
MGWPNKAGSNPAGPRPLDAIPSTRGPRRNPGPCGSTSTAACAAPRPPPRLGNPCEKPPLDALWVLVA